MLDWLQSPSAQSIALLGTFAVVGTWECLWPRRQDVTSLAARWCRSITLTALGALLVKACVPVATIAVALYAQQQHWGALNVAQLPLWAALVLGVVALDLATYAVHRLFHAVPLLWRLHQVHHSDLEFDCATAIRHHPVEILLTYVLQLVIVLALGVAPIAVVLSELLELVVSLFNHGNVMLPVPIDRVLRRVVVTPDMHRVHHSVAHGESNSNYANVLACWDRLFGTYCAQPAVAHPVMHLGIACARSPADVSLTKLLMLPFRRAAAPEMPTLDSSSSPSSIVEGTT
jgi:sterol desaturase/sphingolipid hydroxylase (fatty acid hydroxylase superfamily)